MMEEKKQTLAQFVEKYGVLSVAHRVAERMGGLVQDGNMVHWIAELSVPGRGSTKLYFSHGYAWKPYGKERFPSNAAPGADFTRKELLRFGPPGPKISDAKRNEDLAKFRYDPPHTVDVLDSLAMDCSSVEQAGDIYDWLAEIGVEPGNAELLRETAKAYQKIQEHRAGLIALLGEDGYEELLHETEEE